MSDYATLGLDSSATEDEVKKAYRKLAKEWHPDLNNGDDTKFKEVKGAYERIISGKPYSESSGFGGAGRHSHRDPFAGMGGFGYESKVRNPFYGFDFDNGNMDDILEQMRRYGYDPTASGFGARSRKSADIKLTLSMTFKESVFGGSFNVKYQQKQKPQNSEYETCPTCKGSGKFRKSIGLSLKKDECMNCNGTGKVARFSRSIEQEFLFKSPPGLSTGKKVIVRGRGHQDQEQNGDLYVHINVREDDYFTMIDNKDLAVNIPITISQAILGGEIFLNNLKGEKIKLFIPAGTEDGKVFLLRGMGVPGKGDLLVRINIAYPESVTSEERELLRRLDTLNKNSGNHDPLKIK